MVKTVHIVDDDEDVRVSLELLVQALGYKAVTYETGDSFLQNIAELETACVLLDIRMPGRDGMDVLKAIRDKSKSTHVIMMTGHGDIPLAVRAIQEGADNFIEKPFEASRIKTLLEASQNDEDTSDPLVKLTPREREIAALLSQGQSNKEIGFQLGISSRTVEVHRARLMLKLGITSAAELVHLILGK